MSLGKEKIQPWDERTKPWWRDGLSKRELFAAMAMQGLCVPSVPGHHNMNDAAESKMKAEMALRLADAILAELSKEQK